MNYGTSFQKMSEVLNCKLSVNLLAEKLGKKIRNLPCDRSQRTFEVVFCSYSECLKSVNSNIAVITL